MGGCLQGGPQAISSQDVLGVSCLHLEGPWMAQPSLSPSLSTADGATVTPDRRKLPGRVSCRWGGLRLGASKSLRELWPIRVPPWGGVSAAQPRRAGGRGGRAWGGPAPSWVPQTASVVRSVSLFVQRKWQLFVVTTWSHLFYFWVNIRNPHTSSCGLDLGFTAGKTWNPLQLGHQPWGIASLVLGSGPGWCMRGDPSLTWGHGRRGAWPPHWLALSFLLSGVKTCRTGSSPSLSQTPLHVWGRDCAWR